MGAALYALYSQNDHERTSYKSSRSAGIAADKLKLIKEGDDSRIQSRTLLQEDSAACLTGWQSMVCVLPG